MKAQHPIVDAAGAYLTAQRDAQYRGQTNARGVLAANQDVTALGDCGLAARHELVERPRS